jgi:hypothetical protein
VTASCAAGRATLTYAAAPGRARSVVGAVEGSGPTSSEEAVTLLPDSVAIVQWQAVVDDGVTTVWGTTAGDGSACRVTLQALVS